MPVAISAQSQVLTWNAPTITNISPTNPLVPGKPIEVSVAKLIADYNAALAAAGNAATLAVR